MQVKQVWWTSGPKAQGKVLGVKQQDQEQDHDNESSSKDRVLWKMNLTLDLSAHLQFSLPYQTTDCCTGPLRENLTKAATPSSPLSTHPSISPSPDLGVTSWSSKLQPILDHWITTATAAAGYPSAATAILTTLTSLTKALELQLQQPAMQILLVIMAAHALLHLYYIATWETQHGKHVVQMSTVKTMRDRCRRYCRSEVVWFLVGTTYDIMTHVLMLGVLMQLSPWVFRV